MRPGQSLIGEGRGCRVAACRGPEVDFYQKGRNMPLSIKDAETEKMATEIALRMGESKTEAIRKALHERRLRLVVPAAREERWARVQRLLREEIWPEVDRLHLKRTSRKEKERILGYGKAGV